LVDFRQVACHRRVSTLNLGDFPRVACHSGGDFPRQAGCRKADDHYRACRAANQTPADFHLVGAAG
jgi:hypothetical protein